MAYFHRAGSLGPSAALRTCTLRGRQRPSRTASVQFICTSLLTAGLTAWAPFGSVWAGQAADGAYVSRAQAAGWLELQRDQRFYRERLGRDGAGLTPEVAADLGMMERQEDLDRRALDRREGQWPNDLKRRQNLTGSVGPSQAPALRLRIERAEAGERLRLELRRQTLSSPPGMTPILAPPPFRLH
jgi:hypothetical protein